MLSDIVIAQAAKMLPIAKVAEKLGLTDEDLIPYGRYKAKINHKLIHSDRPDGKLILMTAAPPLLARAKPPPVLAWRTP
jgi:formate--tetrahydrofolate ligase